MLRCHIRSVIAVAATIVLIAPVEAYATSNADENQSPAAFSQIDTNADDVITFSEFAAFAATQGQPRAQAAQTFLDLANGNVLITLPEYRSGVTASDSPQPIGTDIDTDEMHPTETDPYSPRALYGRILSVTPNEEVAGEVIRAFEAERWDEDSVADEGI